MLLELSISDFAIIASTRLTFGPGMQVLTGETGAGKSILLDALGAVLGERSSVDLVRSGAERARIEALFDLEGLTATGLPTLLSDKGIDVSDSQLVVTREIHENGRSVARINGQIVTVSLLGQVGDYLVDIHGQSDHFSIRRTEEQRRILDHYAGTTSLVDEVARLTVQVESIRHRISSLESGERERAQRRDLLDFQVQEIDAAMLEPGEDEALTQEQHTLAHAEQLREDTELAIQMLAGGDALDSAAEDAISRLRTIESLLGRVAGIDPTSGSMSERAAELVILADELGRDLRDYLDGLEVNEERLSEVEDRLEAIRTLKRKYGASIEDVLQFREDAASELAKLSGGEFDLDSLEARLREDEQALATIALQLSTQRVEAAQRLASEIQQSIASLRLGNAIVVIDVEQFDDADGLSLGKDRGDRRVRFDRTGIDKVEFLIAANRGETPRPLGRVASGGETARIMLAIKSIVSEHDSTPTLVFDEIDVGVGGRTGQVVGERLRALSGQHQVIVITHLPQIAALADRHARIEKSEHDGRVVSTVRYLPPDEIETEIAAMLDGEPVTATSIRSAREMIRRSRRSTSRVEA